MHRRPLTDLLSRYLAAWPDEHRLVERFRGFIAQHDDCLLRTCAPGHITASCWILDPADRRVLLTHHRKLDRWLQLGGHVDGEAEIERAALREAQEESGMAAFDFVPWWQRISDPAALVPLDLDVHPIPARRSDPEHDHWDVRFLLRAQPGQALAMSDESNDLRWFSFAELPRLTDEDSVLRLQQKTAALLGLDAAE